MAYLVSLPNPGQEGKPKFLHSDNPTLIERWIKAENRPGFGVYYLPNPLKPGATTHSKENIAGISCIYVDVDFKDVTETADEVMKRLGDLLLQPTLIVSSGHGCHVLWQLKEETACDAPEFEDVCGLQAALIDYLGADPQVRPWSLLRQPGTLNSKREPHVLCEVLSRGPVVDISELRELVEIVGAAKLLTRKYSQREHLHATAETDERKPPIDVDARLQAMKLNGPGDSSIHQTQLSVTASLLRAGVALEETTRTVLEATRAAVANDATWDWRREELKIVRMGVDFIVKHPELAVLVPDRWRVPFDAALADGRHRPDIGLNQGGFYVRAWKIKSDSESAKPSSSADGGPSPGTDKTKAAGGTARVILKPFAPIDPLSLPRRQWLYGKHYQRRVVSATIAPGGTGKTSLVMVEAVSLATARNLLGEQPEERCRVWLHNGEDSREELNRRVVAICQHYKIPQQELQGWLFLTSGTEMALKVANGYSELKVDNALVAEMTRVIADNAIDVVMFDPLVTLHSVNESDNGRMDTVIRIFAKLADVCDCSVDISHHTRKLAAGAFDHTVDDTRGASSVRDAVRMLRILNIMSHNDAENLGFDDFERLSYFRVDRGKANSVAPASSATWRKFESVDLANGDNVGVVTPWDLPAQDTTSTRRRKYSCSYSTSTPPASVM